MIKIKYDIDLMKFISIFETLTRTNVKDCIAGDPLIFVVNQGDIAKAIGKNASNIRRVEGIIKKSVKVVEFNDDVCEFVRNVIAPLRVAEVSKEENKIMIKDPNTKTKGMIIGRDSSNLKKTKDIVSRYFQIEDIVIVR